MMMKVSMMSMRIKVDDKDENVEDNKEMDHVEGVDGDPVMTFMPPLQMERQLVMQNQMRERQMAMQIAWSREFLKYFGSFFTLASLGLTAG